MKFTPDMNDGKSVFVFGSNHRGVHGAGAALDASRHWGAKRGVAVERQGMAYAIPTKNHWLDKKGLPLDEINGHVFDFLNYARQNPDLNFLVTPIGTGYAAHPDWEISPMFADAPDNCVLPEGWRVNIDG